MTQIEKLQQLFSQAQTDYPNLKKEIESQAVSWFWATNTYYSLEPFWFEDLNFRKGKILKKAPEKTGGKYQYGVDKNGEIIIERQYVELEYYPEEHFYETFIFRNGDEILSYHFDYTEKNPINIKRFVYENDILTAIYSVFEEGGFWKENFVYENNKLTQKDWYGRDVYGESFDRVKHYSYDDMGNLQSITEGDYVWYQAKL